MREKTRGSIGLSPSTSRQQSRIYSEIVRVPRESSSRCRSSLGAAGVPVVAGVPEQAARNGGEIGTCDIVGVEGAESESARRS